ncbi:HAD-IIIC family phosphatase [Nocardia sp. CDC159]|uniref:HAD-IIIC family phosphatase n=1 Tax=Nocardia pulmonis TaxID=2951408 RepID=A0A9X2EEU3_9NOCA|nr:MULTISPECIES: HAD-IIIC family phosphatase [Nocardia]MCM6779030.1 HAD-IIIC family phosphatase [Nocardia pulmonis]MCM6791920.1 HAD-IIIC family phosphatase [Nocardia sp. CDC159]
MTADITPVKCLVWDLDNTLWRGTLLEGDRVEPFEQIRHIVETLDRRGILQSIASKNDHEPAWAQLEQLGLAEYFVLPRIGWQPKSQSVREIADGLNFAHSAMAFVDDQPAERAEVRYHLPEVRCYTADQVAGLLALSEFSPATDTIDSRRRRQMYQAGFRRDAARQEHTGPDHEFLRSLDIEMRISRATEVDLSRVEELTVRTTQMNTTGVYYPQETLRALLDDPRHEVLVAAVSDRFGPYGAVGVVLLEKLPTVWHLKLLATSCRVLSLGAGSTILDWLCTAAARSGVHLIADFRATERNRMMEVAYRFAGFTDEACECRARLRTDADSGARLHLVPSEHEPSATVRLSAPDLGSTVSA